MRTIHAVFAFAAAGLVLAACGGSTSTKCSKDTDCKTGQVCASNVCAAKVDGTGGGAGGGTGGSVGGGAGGGQGTDAGTDAGTVAAGDTCGAASSVTTGSFHGTTVGASDDYQADGTGCSILATDGPDVVYKVTVPDGQRLTVTVTPDAPADGGLEYDMALYFIEGPASACVSPVACLVDVDQSNTAAESAMWLNTTGAPKELFLVVDSNAGNTYSANAGGFTLDVQLATPPADDVCAGAAPLTVGGSLTNVSFAGYGNDYHAGTNCKSGGGPDRVYALDVAPGQQLRVVATPSTGLDLDLNLVADAPLCGVTCEVGVDEGGSGDPETLAWTNANTASRKMLLIVGSFNSGAGTFSLTTSVGPPPPGDTCASAPALDGGVLAGQSTAGANNDYDNGTNCVGNTSGPDQAYSLVVPGGKRATITVTPSASYNPSLNVVAGATPAVCTAVPLVCAAGVDDGYRGEVESLIVYNAGTTDQPYYALVDGTSGGDFSIGVVIDSPPVGDFCGNATALTPGTLAGQDLAGFSPNYNGGTDCSAQLGADRAYTVVVDPGLRFSATVTPTTDGGFDPVLNVVAAPATNCEAAARTCVTSADLGYMNDPESVAFLNSSATAQTYYLIVGSSDRVAPDTAYTLTSVVGVPGPGDVCGTALPVTPGTPLTAQKSVGLLRDYKLSSANGCKGHAGADIVYSVAVAAGKTLTVDLTNVALTCDPGISIIAGASATACSDGATCVAGEDTGGNGGDEHLTWLNNTGSNQPVYIVVGSYYAGEDLLFDLAVNVQ